MSQKYKNALPAAGGAAGSGDGPRLDPVAVQNYAYLKLLKWDHLHRPFPEVGAPGQADCSFLSCTAELLKNNSYNSHSRKVFLCKPCNSWDFSTFTQLCFHYRCFISEHRHHPKGNPGPVSRHYSPSSPHPLATYSLSRWIWPILDFLFKRNHTILAVHV